MRNGSDLPPTTQGRRPDPEAGLTFGYLGTAAFPVDYLRAVLEGWRMARQVDPVLARSRLAFRGHFGWQSADMADGRRALLARFAPDGVVFGGPVARVDVAATYAEWDALVFLISGGRYMTSGKIYEYMSTGLPIMSAHDGDHGALEVLRGYPPWIPPPAKIAADLLSESFVAFARTVLSATEKQREAALVHASPCQRRGQLAPAVRDLVDCMGEPPPLADRHQGDLTRASSPT